MEMDLYIYINNFYRSEGKFFVIDTKTCLPLPSIKTTKFIIAYIALHYCSHNLEFITKCIKDHLWYKFFKELIYPTIILPFSNLPFKVPTRGGGPGDVSLVLQMVTWLQDQFPMNNVP